MTIRIDIKPEVRAELERRAAAAGVAVGVYAAGLLECAAGAQLESKTLGGRGLDDTLRELAQYSQKIPLLPDEAFARENMYRDLN